MKFEKIALFVIFFIFLAQVVIAQKGLLKIVVKDCSTQEAIVDAEVNINISSTELTDNNGIAYFALPPGTYTITASKSGYSFENISANVYSDQITKKEICLENINICKISASIRYSVTGKNVSLTVTLTNEGNRGEYVNAWVYACNTKCEYICSKGVYVPSYGSYDLSCKKDLAEGDYKIKVTYLVCSKSYSLYSEKFSISKCEEKYLNSFRCYGSYRQQLYQYSNCSTEWRSIEFCTYGCDSGFCLPKSIAKLGNPVIILSKEYTAKPCEVSILDFEIKNLGDEGNFEIEAFGEASQWIKLISPVKIGENERKTIIGYISLPCDAKGEYEFGIKASDKTSDYSKAIIKVEERKEDFAKIFWNIVGIAIACILIIIIVRYFRTYVPSRKREEAFRK